jgi:DNA-binding NtrC family response regulator
MIHVGSRPYGELTAAYGQLMAKGHSLESGNIYRTMQTYRRAGTVIFVSTRSPEAAVVQDIEAHGLEMQWARNISAAADLLNSAREKTLIVTELALSDGNWRDLIDRVRCTGIPIPIVLLTSSITAELWWDALECGVDEILPPSLKASRLCQLLDTQFTP